MYSLRNPGSKLFHGAPTRAQAKAIFWEPLKHDTKLLWSRKPSETELVVRLFGGSEIHVVGLDKPERIEGQPWDGCHLTEMANMKPQAWPENIRPVLSDTNGFAMLDGVPEGRNFYYELALSACGGALPETLPKIGAFMENPDDPEWCYYHWFSSDVLSDSEIAAARRDLDERQFRQEYKGSFEDYEGLAYYSYGQHNIDDSIEYNENEYVHIGMDFNVNPMTAVFCHIQNDTVLQFGEAFLRESNTFQMCDHIKELFPVRMVTIYPDSTGKSERSNATRSDIVILKKAGFKVLARSSNPRQKDRINAMNRLMKNNGEKTRYRINSKNCPKTINDFNRVESLPDGRLNKQQEKTGLVHTTDGLGYLVNYLFPVKIQIYGNIAR